MDKSCSSLSWRCSAFAEAVAGLFELLLNRLIPSLLLLMRLR